MRWQKRGGLSWDKGAVDGLGYVCSQCRDEFAPSAVASGLYGLLWACPLVAVAGFLDYFTKTGGGLTAFSLFVGFLTFVVVMSGRTHGTYRGYPVPEGFKLRSAPFKTDGITFGQGIFFLVAFFGFGAGCMTLVSAQTNSGFTGLYAPIAATLLGGAAYLGKRRGDESDDQDSMRNWCPKLAQQSPDPNHPDHAAKECAKILTRGGTEHDCIQALTKEGASRTSTTAALAEIAPRIAFMRSTRGDVVQGTQCDLCDTTFPAKVVEKIEWKWSKTTYIPLYIVTITSTESETKTGYHLWCPLCEWKATGRGGNLWAVAGSFGALVSTVVYTLLDPFIPTGYGFFSYLFLWFLFTVGAAAPTSRYRYRGYPLNQGFFPPGASSSGTGGLLVFCSTLASLALMAAHHSWTAHPALKTVALLAALAGFGFLYRLYARKPD